MSWPFLAQTSETPPHALGRLRADGRIFRVGADPWRWKGVSAFPLIDRISRGDDVAPFLETFADLGYNLLRVWPYVPVKDWGSRAWDWPASSDVVLDTLAICRSFGFYVELTLLTDDDPSRANQAVHLVGDLHAANPDNLVLEIMNEAGIGKRDITEALRPVCEASGFLFSSGQYQDPARHVGTFLTDHSSRDSEWARKAKNAREFYDGGGPNSPSDPPHHMPIVEDEPIRPDQTDAATRYLDYRAYGGIAAMMGAGATFHSTGGKYCERPTEDERICAQEMARGLDAFPLDAALGAYRRIDEAGLTLRTYVIGNAMVRVRPKTNDAPEPGWQAIDADGILWKR